MKDDIIQYVERNIFEPLTFVLTLYELFLRYPKSKMKAYMVYLQTPICWHDFSFP